MHVMRQDVSYDVMTMPRESSREELVAAARRACAGGKQPTMQDIAASAGVAVRTLYRFFGGRSVLLSEAGCRPAPDTRDQILESALELVFVDQVVGAWLRAMAPEDEVVDDVRPG